MEKLSERQKIILSLVIHEYTRTAQPVGSKTLVDKYRLEFSSATVRNELAALTEMGYLNQPHTSAGRVPTEKGYRFFVGALMQMQELSDASRRMIEHQFYQTQQDQGIDGWMKLAASILATHSGAVSLVSAPLPVRTGLKHLALISITGKQFLIVMVLVGGQMQQRFVSLDNPVAQSQLTMIANEINHRFSNMGTVLIREEMQQNVNLDPLFDLVMKNILDIMFETDSLKAGEVYTDGISNVLSEPEFSESEDARKALKILEEKPVLQSFLSRTSQDQKIGGIQILIGGEGMLENLNNCSMVIARYGMQNLLSGTIGVLGPMRMAYGKNIPTVRFIANLLSDLVAESIGDIPEVDVSGFAS